jgi:hypothetical protein
LDGGSKKLIELPAPPNTEILLEDRQAIFFGIGTLRCDAICINLNGSIRWQTTVARDNGLTLPLTLRPEGGVWVPTNRRILLLDQQTGEEIKTALSDKTLYCISNILIHDTSALVVVIDADENCKLIHISSQGDIMSEHALPPLRRAHLYSSSENGEAWLIGSTVFVADPVEVMDRSFVIMIDKNSKPKRKIELPGERSIEGVLAPGGHFWLATYTDDGRDRGMLYLLDRNGDITFRWSPKK